MNVENKFKTLSISIIAITAVSIFIFDLRYRNQQDGIRFINDGAAILSEKKDSTWSKSFSIAEYESLDTSFLKQTVSYFDLDSNRYIVTHSPNNHYSFYNKRIGIPPIHNTSIEGKWNLLFIDSTDDPKTNTEVHWPKDKGYNLKIVPLGFTNKEDSTYISQRDSMNSLSDAVKLEYWKHHPHGVQQ